MAINIESFKANLIDGGARANLFRLDFSGVIQLTSEAARQIPYLCKATSLPPSTLGVIEVPYMGRKIKVAGDRTYGEWTVTIINREDFIIRAALEDWSHRINHYQTNERDITSYNLSQYKQDITVEQLDKSGNPIAAYTVVGAYPSEVGPIEVAWETTDTLEEFNVTFQLDYWVPQAKSIASQQFVGHNS